MLIDSNIIVYSINSSSPKHKAAQQFLQNNVNSLDIAHQNIFESLRVLTHPKFVHPMPINDALVAINNIADKSNIIFPDYKTHRIALEIISKYNLFSDQVFDAYLTATALSNEIACIATDNEKDFSIFEELKVVNPFK